VKRNDAAMELIAFFVGLAIVAGAALVFGADSRSLDERHTGAVRA
jgi:hypothetical protein